MSRRLTNRLTSAVRRHPPPAKSFMDEMVERWRRECEEFVTRHVPEDLRDAVRAGLEGRLDGGASSQEVFSSWRLWPFARWARPMPDDYVFPRALVECLVASGRRVLMGHHCGRCGLAVPIYLTWSNDPNPPPTVIIFPECPACGGRTSHAAFWGPDDRF